MRLVACSDEAESRQRVTPFHRLMGCHFRPLLYAGIRLSGYYVPLDNVAWIRVPFGPAFEPVLAGSA